MPTDRTPALMTKLSEIWGDRDFDDSIRYWRNTAYQPHTMDSEAGPIASRTLRALLDRGWLQDTREALDASKGPRGSLSLTDEGRDIVQAFS